MCCRSSKDLAHLECSVPRGGYHSSIVLWSIGTVSNVEERLFNKVLGILGNHGFQNLSLVSWLSLLSKVRALSCQIVLCLWFEYKKLNMIRFWVFLKLPADFYVLLCFIYLSHFSVLLFGNGCHLKLCDFGTCRKLESNLLYTASIGTVRYMAPEVIKGKLYIHVHVHRCM